MRLQLLSLASLSKLTIQRCCELWCRPAAIALIGPLAWEPPYAAGTALEKEKKKKSLQKANEKLKTQEATKI